MPTAPVLLRKLLPDGRLIRSANRTETLRVLDGRSREARRIKTIAMDLAVYLGGPERVNAAQRLLIDRAAVDLVRLEKLDARMTAGTLTELDGRIAHALRNSVRLVLRDLGLPPPASSAAPSFDQHIAELRARKAPA
jgi:hypothetical protein